MVRQWQFVSNRRWRSAVVLNSEINAHSERAINITSLDKVNVALLIAIFRRDENPTLPMLQSIVTQLQYMVSVLKGENSDKSRMKDIIVGLYAVREFEETDPDFADALMEAQEIAGRISSGLKA